MSKVEFNIFFIININRSIKTPIPKNVKLKLWATKNLLALNPKPPLIKRTEELRLAMSGRSSSGKSVSTVETELWLIVQPTAIKARTITTKTMEKRIDNKRTPK